MYFCCCFVFSVLGPIHALGYQFNSCRVNCSDGPFETPGQPEITSSSLGEKLGMRLLVMLNCFPEKLLYQSNIPCPISMRQSVSIWCRCIPDIVKITFKVLQAIAYIIKTDAMSHVAIYHADDMAPHTECPGCNLDSFLVQFCAHICKAVFRNKLAKLS